MRTIEPTTRFRRDYKREKRGRYGKRLGALLTKPSTRWQPTHRSRADIKIIRSPANGQITATATSAPI
jgi:hypothetical protein